MPVKFKTPKAQGKRAQEKHEKILASLKILAEKQNKVAMHLLELWDDSEHIRVMIDYGGNDAAERFVHSHPDVTTKPENKKATNLGMHCDFGFDNVTCQYTANSRVHGTDNCFYF